MDYNIYIHDKTSQTRPTQARKGGGTNTTSKQTSNGAASGFSLKNIKKGFKNIPALGKVGIVLYAVKKAVDLATRVVDKVEPFVTRETGDYRFNIVYNNTKQMFSNITNPFSAFMSDVTKWQENKIFNKKQEQERLLIGDSYINSTTRKV